MHIRLFLIIASFLTHVCLAAFASTDRDPRVMVITVDGFRADVLEVAETPHMDYLIENGAFTGRASILGERYQGSNTQSAPGFSSLMTGVWADKHGVVSNDLSDNNFDRYPHFFARLKEQRREAKTISLLTWENLADYLVGDHADLNHLEGLPDSPEEVLPNRKLRDVKMANRLAGFLEELDPTAVWLRPYFPDAVGHRIGFSPDIPEYVEAIEHVDRIVGKVVEAIRSRPTYKKEDWLILISADHGGKGTSHRNGHEVPEIRYVPLIVSGPSATQGKIEGAYIVDVAVTALTHLGIEIDEAWELDGKPVGLSSSNR